MEVKDIGRDTSFFVLGEDSISIIKVAAACAKIGLPVTLPQLIKDSVVVGMGIGFGVVTHVDVFMGIGIRWLWYVRGYWCWPVSSRSLAIA